MGFDKLEIYKLASELAEWIYDLTENFPDNERYVLIVQIRRAVLSIGANIAEGNDRFHYKERIHFLYYARGSLAEVKHFMLFSKNRNYINKKELEDFLTRYKNCQIKINNCINSISDKV